MSIIEKIKLLFVVKQPVTEIVGKLKDLKTGWKTLPWWISIVASLATVAASIGGFIPATTAVIVTVAVTFVYQVLRAIENAQMNGVAKWYVSTRFWSGLLAVISTALLSLQTGGIDPKWVGSALAVIGMIMGVSQNVGGQAVVPAPPAPPAK